MTPAEIEDALNDYETHHPFPWDGYDVWEHVIYRIPGYDEERTRILDPGDLGDRFVADGIAYRLERADNRWYRSN